MLSLPVKVTDVALLALTVNVELVPAVIDGGSAAMEMVGLGFAETVIVMVAEVVPPGPIAVAV